MQEIEILETLSSSFMVVWNGYQWGDDPALFDHSLGCSSQTWVTKKEAESAVASALEAL